MKMLSRRYRVALATAAAAAALVGSQTRSSAQDLAPQLPHLPPTPFSGEGGLTVYPLRGGLYMITGPGANTLVSVGYDGVLVVDPQPGAATQALLSQIRKLETRPVRIVVNTTGDADHMGGNQAVAAAGESLEAGTVGARPQGVYGAGGAKILAYERVLARLTEAGGDAKGWPTDTYFVAQKDMFFNGDAVALVHANAAHSDGDSLVVFRRNDVIAVGDIYTPDRYPVIDLKAGGGIDGLIDGLNTILRMTIPEFNEEGGTLIVPGHGRLSDEGDVADYRDMITIVRDRVKDMISRKMSLAQVKAAKPTLDYDARYGADKGDIFVEQVYNSLTSQQKGKKAAEGRR